MSAPKIILFVLGFSLVIGGIALSIRDWFFIQIVFRAVIGPLLAVAGLVMLAISRD